MQSKIMKSKEKSNGSAPMDAVSEHLLSSQNISLIQPVRLYRLQIPDADPRNPEFASRKQTLWPWKRVLAKVIQILVSALACVVGVIIVSLLAHWSGCHQLASVGGLAVGVLTLHVYLWVEDWFYGWE